MHFFPEEDGAVHGAQRRAADELSVSQQPGQAGQHRQSRNMGMHPWEQGYTS